MKKAVAGQVAIFLVTLAIISYLGLSMGNASVWDSRQVGDVEAYRFLSFDLQGGQTVTGSIL